MTYSRVILKASFETTRVKHGQLQDKHCLIFGGLLKLILRLLSNQISFFNAFNEFQVQLFITAATKLSKQIRSNVWNTNMPSSKISEQILEVVTN